MAKKLQILRGTTAQNDAYTGSIGELTMDTEKVEVRIHDGTTQGGKTIGSGGGASLPILMAIWSDHLLNDMSWLRADTFSWQSGDVYVAAYNHLTGEFKTEQQEYYAWSGLELALIFYTEREMPLAGDIVYTTGLTEDEWTEYGTLVSDYDGSGYLYISSQRLDVMRSESKDIVRAPGFLSDTIGDITITYYLADDGHKICLPDQENNIMALYGTTGAADYYILDTTNKQFKLPRKQKRTLIQAVKNDDGAWYNLYSDGWVEQGGDVPLNSTNVVLPIEMQDTSYECIIMYTNGNTNNVTFQWLGALTKNIASFTCMSASASYRKWHVTGYAAESAYASAGMRLEYYHVGNFTQEAIEQTAGLNAELFNGKADRNLLNTTDNVDIVIESQLPTETNGYTWYRKYKSGWVEQGGVLWNVATGAHTITLPVELSGTDCLTYGPRVWFLFKSGTIQSQGVHVDTSRTYTTTSFQCYSWGATGHIGWQVCGMSAQ